MPYKDPEKKKARDRKHYQENRDKVLERIRRYELTPQGVKNRIKVLAKLRGNQ